jgi:hypothetical protein
MHDTRESCGNHSMLVHLNGALAGDDGLHEEAQHGEHGQPAVLDLLDLQIDEKRPSSHVHRAARNKDANSAAWLCTLGVTMVCNPTFSSAKVSGSSARPSGSNGPAWHPIVLHALLGNEQVVQLSSCQSMTGDMNIVAISE